MMKINLAAAVSFDESSITCCDMPVSMQVARRHPGAWGRHPSATHALAWCEPDGGWVRFSMKHGA